MSFVSQPKNLPSPGSSEMGGDPPRLLGSQRWKGPKSTVPGSETLGPIRNTGCKKRLRVKQGVDLAGPTTNDPWGCCGEKEPSTFSLVALVICISEVAEILINPEHLPCTQFFQIFGRAPGPFPLSIDRSKPTQPQRLKCGGIPTVAAKFPLHAAPKALCKAAELSAGNVSRVNLCRASGHRHLASQGNSDAGMQSDLWVLGFRNMNDRYIVDKDG